MRSIKAGPVTVARKMAKIFVLFHWSTDRGHTIVWLTLLIDTLTLETPMTNSMHQFYTNLPFVSSTKYTFVKNVIAQRHIPNIAVYPVLYKSKKAQVWCIWWNLQTYLMTSNHWHIHHKSNTSFWAWYSCKSIVKYSIHIHKYIYSLLDRWRLA